MEYENLVKYVQEQTKLALACQDFGYMRIHNNNLLKAIEEYEKTHHIDSVIANKILDLKEESSKEIAKYMSEEGLLIPFFKSVKS